MPLISNTTLDTRKAAHSRNHHDLLRFEDFDNGEGGTSRLAAGEGVILSISLDALCTNGWNVDGGDPMVAGKSD